MNEPCNKLVVQPGGTDWSIQQDPLSYINPIIDLLSLVAIDSKEQLHTLMQAVGNWYLVHWHWLKAGDDCRLLTFIRCAFSPPWLPVYGGRLKVCQFQLNNLKAFH